MRLKYHEHFNKKKARRTFWITRYPGGGCSPLLCNRTHTEHTAAGQSTRFLTARRTASSASCPPYRITYNNERTTVLHQALLGTTQAMPYKKRYKTQHKKKSVWTTRTQSNACLHSRAVGAYMQRSHTSRMRNEQPFKSSNCSVV